MTPRDFCYWLQGWFELTNAHHLDSQQVEMIRQHLELVFKKETKEKPISSEQWKQFYKDCENINKELENMPIPMAEDGLPGCKVEYPLDTLCTDLHEGSC